MFLLFKYFDNYFFYFYFYMLGLLLCVGVIFFFLNCVFKLLIFFLKKFLIFFKFLFIVIFLFVVVFILVFFVLFLVVVNSFLLRDVVLKWVCRLFVVNFVVRLLLFVVVVFFSLLGVELRSGVKRGEFWISLFFVVVGFFWWMVNSLRRCVWFVFCIFLSFRILWKLVLDWLVMCIR